MATRLLSAGLLIARPGLFLNGLGVLLGVLLALGLYLRFGALALGLGRLVMLRSPS